MLGPYQWYHEPNPRHFTISCWYCWLFKHCWILQSVGVSSVSSCVSKYQPLAARFFWPLCSEEARTEEDRKGNVEVVKAATTKKCWHAGIYDICTVYIYIIIHIYIFVSLNLICKTSYNLVVHTFHFLSFWIIQRLMPDVILWHFNIGWWVPSSSFVRAAANVYSSKARRAAGNV